MYVNPMAADHPPTVHVPTRSGIDCHEHLPSNNKQPPAQPHCADGKLVLCTLPEVLRYTLPPTTPLTVHRALAMQMAGRWRAVLKNNPHHERTIRNHCDKLVTLRALPAAIAIDCVRTWLPWAVDTLRAEVLELAAQMNITPEAVAAGAAAPAADEDENALL